MVCGSLACLSCLPPFFMHAAVCLDQVSAFQCAHTMHKGAL